MVVLNLAESLGVCQNRGLDSQINLFKWCHIYRPRCTACIYSCWMPGTWWVQKKFLITNFSFFCVLFSFFKLGFWIGQSCYIVESWMAVSLVFPSHDASEKAIFLFLFKHKAFQKMGSLLWNNCSWMVLLMLQNLSWKFSSVSSRWCIISLKERAFSLRQD